MADLIRFTQSTGRHWANVVAEPVTLVRFPGLPEPALAAAPAAAPGGRLVLGGNGAPGQAQNQAPNEFVQKRHSDIDVDLLRAAALLDVTADNCGDFMRPAEEYLRTTRPVWWLAKHKVLREQWVERWAGLQTTPSPQLLAPLRELIGYQKALFKECVKDPPAA